MPKIEALTGIRFLAAAMIVIGHAHQTFGSANLATTFALSQGVSIFFILSGFILAYNYPSLNSKKDVFKFLIARIARLYPLHIATAILLVLLIPPRVGGYLPLDRNLPLYVLSNITLTQSWIPIRNLTLSLNGVSWSISTEFFFYLMFPLLIYKWEKNWSAKLIITMSLLVIFISLGNILKLSDNDFSQGLILFNIVYVNPLVRLFEFTVGIATFHLYKNLNPVIQSLNYLNATFIEVLSIFLVLSSMWVTPIIAYSPAFTNAFGLATRRWFISSGSFGFFALFIFIIALQRGFISHLLKSNPMILLGEISFSLYLVHTILLQFYNYHNFKLPKPYGYLIFWIVALGVSYVLYIGVEKPCRRWIKNLGQKRFVKSEVIYHSKNVS